MIYLVVIFLSKIFLMTLSSAKGFARNDSLKSLSEVHVENSVNNRVESGVDIAQPSDKTNQLEKQTFI